MTLDRVLIRLAPLPKETGSGIIIPDFHKRGTQERRSTTGEVLAVGPDCREVKVGDTVLFDPLSGRDWKDDLTIIPEENLLAIVPANVKCEVPLDQQRRRA